MASASAQQLGQTASEVTRRNLGIKPTITVPRLTQFSIIVDRALIEGVISFLKRAFGLDRATWRGELSFRSYVWSGVLAANLLTLARHELA